MISADGRKKHAKFPSTCKSYQSNTQWSHTTVSTLMPHTCHDDTTDSQRQRHVFAGPDYLLSYDVTSGSEITPCNKIDKPLVNH